jgi:hypothetical protein
VRPPATWLVFSTLEAPVSLYTLVLGIAFICGLIFGFLGRWIAGEKHREPSEGFLLGFLFGPLGVLIEALLPTKEKPKPKAKRRLSRSGWQPPADDNFDQEAADWLRGE